ncbi:FMRFamide receptor [Elysia marginata]|uniref:FMRFamide receptor n=1 Tax=Elysia marginata TaxID=1093978 RepID=A0AAV4JPY6_9GAST|nr:FMRFamide receptor [Elysia marginata]
MATIDEINLKVNISDGDANVDQENPDHLTLFVLWGVLLPLVAAWGLVGNVLTMMVLWRREMNSTTIMYMRGLVITDTGILLGAVTTLTPISLANYLNASPLDYYKHVIYPVIYAPGYYMIMLLQQINVWITVSISLERYIAICHPFRAARIISKKKTIAAMVVITIISMLYNLPHLLAWRIISCSPPAGAQSGGNDTSSINVTQAASDTFEYSADTLMKDGGQVFAAVLATTPSTEENTNNPVAQESVPSSVCKAVVYSEFGTTEFYIFFRSIMYLVIIYVLPFIALLIFNSFLIRELMRMQKRNANIGSKEENEANLSLVLILIVIVFIFCQTPGLISQFDIIQPSVFLTWLGVSNLLFVVNSAVNFLIYTAFGKKFRRVLLRVFRRLSSTASNASKRRRASSASSCHAALTTYSTTEAQEAVEMCPPPKYNGVGDGNGVSPKGNSMT